MVRLFPFAGLRYHPDRIPSLSAVTAPPYDVISPEAQQAFYNQHPANVIRLILNQKEAHDSAENNTYTRAARFFQDWQAEGLLLPESTPSLYAYRQIWQEDDQTTVTRSGLIALMQLEALQSPENPAGYILPHEHTLGGPKQDRLQLMRETQANLSQIFMIYQDPERSLETSILSSQRFEAERQQKLFSEATETCDVCHQLFPLSDAGEIEQVQHLFDNKRLLIADGHHRYETALTFQAEARAAYLTKHGKEAPPGSLPTDFVMVFLTNLQDDGLRVYPTHRVLHRLPEGWDTHRLLTHLQTLRSCANASSQDPLAPGSFRFERPGHAPLDITVSESCQQASKLPKEMQTLDVALLDTLVFQQGFQQSADALKHAGILSFHRDEATVDQLLQTGEAVAVFRMGTPNCAQIFEIAEAGYRMPQKSTYFYPKLLSGLVFYPYQLAPACAKPV